MQHGLPLLPPATQVPRRTILFDLRDVAPDGVPAADLAVVFAGHAAPHVVAAVPLEPAARVHGVDPSFLPPDAERLARVDAEVIEFWIVPLGAELGVRIPVRGELGAAIGHVLAAEDAEPQHLFGREIGSEARVEIFSFRFGEHVGRGLHFVLHVDDERPLGFLRRHLAQSTAPLLF